VNSSSEALPPRDRPKERLVFRVEREMHPVLGLHFQVGVGRLFLLGNQPESAGPLEFQPQRVRAGQGRRQRLGEFQGGERIGQVKGHGPTARADQLIDRLFQFQEIGGERQGPTVEGWLDLEAIARFQGGLGG